MLKNRQKKLIEIPLFPGYIFVNTTIDQIFRITYLPKIVTFISFGGRPSFLLDKEVEGIKIMCGINRELSVEDNFVNGEKVRIISGPLIGYEGFLINKKGKNRFGIQIEALNQMIFVEVRANVIKKAG